ncbi:MAG: MoaD/ThiS family protein [Planctomycetota bacterium]
MPRVTFTSNLQRHVAAPDCRVDPGTTAQVLAQVFAQHPRLRSYVLDDQGALRHHMQIFVDGRRVVDRSKLSDPVGPQAEVYVLQALSGG